MAKVHVFLLNGVPPSSQCPRAPKNQQAYAFELCAALCQSGEPEQAERIGLALAIGSGACKEAQLHGLEIAKAWGQSDNADWQAKGQELLLKISSGSGACKEAQLRGLEIAKAWGQSDDADWQAKGQELLLQISTGGRPRCSTEACPNVALFPGPVGSRQGVAGKCTRHGGSPRCSTEACHNVAVSPGPVGSRQGVAGKCTRHGGGPRCIVAVCPYGSLYDGMCYFHSGGGGAQAGQNGQSAVPETPPLACQEEASVRIQQGAQGLPGQHVGVRDTA